jgi:trehalose synthase
MLHNVPVSPLPIERFRTVLDDAGYRDLLALRDRAQGLLAGRAVWCVNSTATGGGVAEMLRSLLAYTRGAGVDTRWLVLNGTPEFFAVTKGLHNRLHAATGDLPPLGEQERAAYDAVTVPAAHQLAEMLRPGDVVLLHDPQTLGMAPILRERPVGIVWRAHVGVDEPDDRTRVAWDFLRPYARSVDACVFSRERFVWDGLDEVAIEIVPPSIDVFSAKNQELDDAAALAILRAAGIVADGEGPPGVFLREDGTPARVDRRATIVQERALRAADRYVTQVSRWDRLKDPVGVLEGFVRHVGEESHAQLLLVGPDVAGVADDPEGAEVLEEVAATWHALPEQARARAHLVTLPMQDAEENGAMVNAIQRRASVVVQKSLAEGFGLTVAEAAWKGRPIVASGVGGIQDQVVDEVTGLLVAPRDLAAYGHAVSRLLADDDLARRLGSAARERVRERFLEPRHLRQWVDLIERLPATPRA